MLTIEIARRFYPAARIAKAYARRGNAYLALQNLVFGSQSVAPAFVREGDLLPGPRGAASISPVLLGRVASRDDVIGTIEFASPLPISIDGSCPLFVRELGSR